jgi:hypothetical protein
MAETQQERLKKDEQIRDTIMAKLVESGEKDKLKEMLRERLVQCGMLVIFYSLYTAKYFDM